MKTVPLLVVLGVATLLSSACHKQEGKEEGKDNTTRVVERPETVASKTVANDTAVAVQQAAVESWDSIKDYTYEKRIDFADQLDRMTAQREADVAGWTAQTARLSDSAAAAREKAGQDFDDARAYLKTQTAHLRTVTSDTWDDAKEKTTEAWQRLQAAYEKLKNSPTS